jgi:sugar lactone lactonase YvrE
MKRAGLLVIAGIIACTLGVQAAESPDYVVDKSFSVTSEEVIKSIVVIDSGNIAATRKDKTLIFVDTNTGTITKTVDIESSAAPSAMTVDKEGNIYVLCTSTEEKTFKFKGRSYKRSMPNGLKCLVYDKAGVQKKVFDIKGAVAAKSAAFSNGELVVADDRTRALLFVNPSTGAVTKKVSKGIRLCCGIFGISKASGSDNILVANLGAFKVEEYNHEGAAGFKFGKKGRNLNDFQGCCNPVNVAQMPDGSIITAEKDPTRIKVYDSTGKNAKMIPGVQELVKGCYYIPMTVDEKGNIYLVVKGKRIIRLKRK